MFGFLITGLFAAFVHLRRERLPWRTVLLPCLAAGAGALAGALTLDWLPAAAVRLFISALALASGLHGLLGSHRHAGAALPLGGVGLTALGLVVGYGSAVSGTGGPVMLIPILLALRIPVARAIALALAIQMPIAATATAVNVAQGRIDFALGLAVAGLLLAGTALGAWVGGRIPASGLTAAVALALVATGLWYGYATTVALGLLT
jgi:hypothetical protein